MGINLKSILPKKSYSKEDIIIKNKGKNLLTYYITKYPTGQPKLKRFQPAKALVPKIIEISNKCIEALGMYQGDGQKSIKSKSYQSTRFVNSESELLKLFLKFLNKLNIKNKNLNFNLRISKNIKYNETYLKKYWSKTLNIPYKNFYKIQWRDNKYKNSKIAPYGTLTIIYSNSSFRLVIDSLLNYIKKQALKDRDITQSFLVGLIAADGNVYFHKTNREVNIAAKSQDDRDYINKLFKNLGIITDKDNLTKGKETVRVTGYPNFKIIERYKLCDLHPEKEIKFNSLINSYKNKCRRKGTSFPLILNLLKTPLSVNNLATKLNRKNNSIRRYLDILENKNKIKRIKDNLHENPNGRIPEKWINKLSKPFKIRVYSRGWH